MNTNQSKTQSPQQQAKVFDHTIQRKVHYEYLLYRPQDGQVDPALRRPLILFLHGIGERGERVDLVRRQGLPKLLDKHEDFPFIVVSPQCPPGAYWNDTGGLMALVDEAIEQQHADPERVYLTGLSMGGYGAWKLAMDYPDRFAAVAPICGGGDVSAVGALKDVPVWVFHGAQDDVVPIHESESMVKALRACEGNVKFTVYPKAGHDAWTETYENPALYEWFLDQRLAMR